MFDLKQLDSLFESNELKKGFDAQKNLLRKQKKYTRLIKITLPAIAAALVGLLAILPMLQDRTDFLGQIAKPSANELEKLHIENTEIFITDKNNRVNHLNAKNVDETEPKSQILKIEEPKGRFLVADDKWVDIVSPTGFYDQTKKFVTLKDKVEIKYNEGMDAVTDEAFYDADTSRVYGNKPVKAWGEYGSLNSQKFDFDINEDLLTLFGKTNIETSAKKFGESTKIEAYKTIKFYKKEQKLVAVGNAKVERQNLIIKGDELTALFAEENGKNNLTDFFVKDNVVVESEKGTAWAKNLKAFFKSDKNGNSVIDKIELTGDVKTKFEDKIVNADRVIYYPNTQVVEMYGNVRTNEENRKIRANKGFYYPSTQIIKMEGNIIVNTEDAEIFAQRGTYDTKNNIAKMYDKVVISKDGNKMNSDYAETNLNTGISKIGKGAKKRVSGVIYENKIKKTEGRP